MELLTIAVYVLAATFIWLLWGVLTLYLFSDSRFGTVKDDLGIVVLGPLGLVLLFLSYTLTTVLDCRDRRRENRCKSK